MAYTSAQLVAAYTAANNGVAPDAATTALLNAFAAQTQTGQLSDAAALSYVVNSAQDDVQVAVQAYQFFTGTIPSTAGLDYLTNSATNTQDLNDPYYAQFNLENRYINFAANLGVVGEGATAFSTTYGGLTFAQYVDVVYETIIGSSYAQTAGINVAAAKADIVARQANFVQIATDRGLISTSSTAAQRDIAVKAAVAGYLMAEGVKADVGIYAAGANNYVQALVSGTAVDGVNLLTTYSVQGGGTGQAVGGTGPVAGGETLTLTAGIDAKTGGAGNDTIVGDATTVSAADQINGAGGSDTFLFYTPGAAAVVPALSNVEVVKFIAPTAGTTANLSAVSGLTEVWLKDATAAANNASLTLGAAVQAGLENVTGATTVTFGGTATSRTLNLVSTSTTGTVNLDGATTLNLDAVGTNSLGALASSANETTVNVTGPGNLTITGALAATVNTFDASTSAGKVDATLGTTTTATTVKGGSAANVFNLTNVTNAVKVTADLGAGDDILALGGNLNTFAVGTALNGGDGTDTVNITDGADLTKATAALLSGFEVLDVGDGKGTYDVTLGKFSSVTINQAVGGALTGAVVLDKAASGFTLTTIASTGDFDLANKQEIKLADATGKADAVNINTTISDPTSNLTADGDVTYKTSTTVAGVENINIAANVGEADPGLTGASYVTTFTDLIANSVQTLTITGNGSVAFTALNNAGNTLTKVDASGSTGNVTLNAAAITTQLAYTGSDGKDTYTATDGGSIYGRGGNDVITLDATAGASNDKSDTIIYKSAADVKFADANSDGKIDAAGGIESITNFMTAATAAATTDGADIIDVSTFAFAGYAGSAVNKGALAVAVDSGNFAMTIADFFADAAGDRGVAFGTNGGDTYVFVDANKDGNWDASADLAIKLVGVSDFAQTSIGF